MTLARPHQFLDAVELEYWAEKYAPHRLAGWQYSDACEYLDFWEWLDLNHPNVLSDFESWYREQHA